MICLFILIRCIGVVQAQWWKEVTSAPLSMSSTAVNLIDTLPYMEGRKSLRRFRGAYMKTRPLLSIVLFLVLLAVWAYRSSLVTNQSVSSPITHHYDICFMRNDLSSCAPMHCF